MFTGLVAVVWLLLELSLLLVLSSFILDIAAEAEVKHSDLRCLKYCFIISFLLDVLPILLHIEFILCRPGLAGEVRSTFPPILGIILK